MARPVKSAEAWYEKAAEIMVREEKSLRQAAMELDLPLTTEECANIERRKTFQKALWAARHKFYKDLSSDPERNKNSVLGQLVFLAQKLIEEREYDKAAEVLFKLAKVEGHVGGENNINIFGNLTPQDIEAERKRIEGQLKPGASQGGTEQVLPN